MRDAVRLALGTLTVLPVPPPRVVDRRTAGRAMVLAPAVGLLLGVLVVAALWLLGGGSLRTSSVPPLLAATLVVALLALLTRGLHLDGVADTVDGLGSGRAPEQALALMRSGDVGPFGVTALVLALLLQVAALDTLLGRGDGPGAVVLALVVSRLALPLVCSRGVRAARPDGLGSIVAGSVSRAQLLAAGLLAAFLTSLVLWYEERGGWDARSVTAVVAGLVLPLVMAGLLARRCVRRLGGVTGDVLGACVETAFTTALVVAAL